MEKDSNWMGNLEVAFASRSNFELQKARGLFYIMMRPWLVKIGVAITRFSLKIKLPIQPMIKATLFQHFCGGISVKDCEKTINHLGKYNIKTILDYSVEGEAKEAYFEKTQNEIIKICKNNNENIPFCVVKLSGLGSFDIMKKIQEKKTISEKEKIAFDKMKNRIWELAQKSFEAQIHFMLDAEESWIQDVVDSIALDLMKEFNKNHAHIYNTYQFYRHDTLKKFTKHLELSRQEGFYLGSKLVRGAYMEKERNRASKLGYPSPIHKNKKNTDQSFDEALKICIKNIDIMGICCATHNQDSSLLLCQLMAENNISKEDKRIYFAQLLGMSDNISFNLSNKGYNVAKYVPYGPIQFVMPYLFRRAEENTAIAGQGSREYDLITNELKRRKK